MWMPHTHTSQGLDTHTQPHYQSLDHSQNGVQESAMVGGYESFNQNATQLGQYGDIFQPMQVIEHLDSATIGARCETHVNEDNEEENIMSSMNEEIEEEHEETGGGQKLEEEGEWGPGLEAKSSQLPSRAHSRSPAPSSNLADNQEARRAEGAWRFLAEAPLASPPSPFPPSAGGLTPSTLKKPVLSGNPHNYQHRSVSQYKSLNSQSKRRLKSSISLDSLRSSYSHSQSSHYSLPLRLSSTTNTTTPTAGITSSLAASVTTTRDQLSSASASTRPSGVDRKIFQSRLRRRPSAQLISSTNILDRLKLEDTMMAQASQHMQPLAHERVADIEDISLHGQLLDKYRVDGPYGAPLPLSPPPSATRSDFVGASTSATPYHLSEDSGLSFNGSELGIGRPQSISNLRNVSSFEHTPEGEELNSQFPNVTSTEETSIFTRQPTQTCWAPSSWLAEIPPPIEMNMMESPPGQSPTAPNWVDDNTDAESSHLRISNGNGLSIMMQGVDHAAASFRLASPPTGRGIHRMPSCPNFRGTPLEYQIQQPPSPALEGNDMVNFPGYMERSCSNSSSIPSPPDSPDFYFSNSQLQTPNLGFPLVTHDVYTSNAYSQMPDSQHTAVRAPMVNTARQARTGISSSAAAAAAAALAATKNASRASKSRNSRRAVSGPNGRSSSSRNGSASSSSGSAGSSRGSGIASEGAEMPFVNYTPLDAQRILSGVAPSGSSKTKARREREALEKQRKFQEAVLRGDVSQLKSD